MKMIVWSLILVILASCAYSPEKNEEKKVHLELFTLEETPFWGKTTLGDSVEAGGFSGLLFLGKTEKGEYQFLTITDRGPNGKPLPFSGAGQRARPFLMPDFQPRLVKLETDSKKKSLKVIGEIRLMDPKGRPLSGRPQWSSSSADEKAVDPKGNALANDLMGIDPEGIAQDSEGFYWVGEEYRPSLLKFDSKGHLIKRFIPRNSLPKAELRKIQKEYGAHVVVEALPEDYKYRKSNRGFEGIAFADGKIHAILQSPLEIPGEHNKKVISMLEFDPRTEKVTGEVSYPLEKEGVDKIGDLATSADGTSLMAIEQNTKTGPESVHLVRKFGLPAKGAQSVAEFETAEGIQKNKETLNLKTVVSLNDIGYNFADKVEGLAVISKNILAVINDNDFGVSNGRVLRKEKAPTDTNPGGRSVLGLIIWRVQ